MKEYAKILDISSLKDKRIIIVGDIHGCHIQFLNLLEKCNYDIDNDIVIAVGDLTDRGPLSDKVLKYFMNTPNTYSVMGNHCWKLLRYLKGNKVSISPGLKKTINQIKDMDKNDIIKYLDNLPCIIKLPYIDNKPLYVVHAGFAPGILPENQTKESCIYIRGINPKNYFDESFGGIWYDYLDGSFNVVCGHIVEKSVNPNPNVFCLDGGAVFGGVLRAAVIENNQIKIIETEGIKIDKNNQNDIEAREDLMVQGLLRCDKMDRFKIYTYTDRCVFENKWDDITLNSRGHIFDIDTLECVARPLSKFFNINEKPETQANILPWNNGFKIFTKEDGWLGILYRHNNEFKIASRGSFYSPGAEKATNILKSKHNLSSLPPEVTLVFEIISNITKIVVDYAGQEKLILLAAFNRFTGEEYSWEHVLEWGKEFGFDTPETKDLKSYEEIVNYVDSLPGNKFEGFVIRFNNGLRVKIKNKDYLRRSKLIQNITPLNIYKLMEDGLVPEKYKEDLDQDYINEFDNISNQLEKQYRELFERIIIIYSFVNNSLEENHTMKEFALRVEKEEHKSAFFAIKKENIKQLNNYIMKLIRPKENKFND